MAKIDQTATKEQPGEPSKSIAASPPLTLKQKLVATIGYLAPDRIQKIAEVWGAAVILGFLLGLIPGFVAAIGLYKGGWVPANWVAPEYRQEIANPTPQVSPAISLVQTRVENPPTTYSVAEDAGEPMRTFWKLLNIEGKGQKDAGLIKDFALGTISSQPMPSGKSVKWGFKVTSSDYRIWGYAVRQSKQSGTLVYEPMRATQDGQQSYIQFDVPTCEPGDVLYATLIITSPGDIGVAFQGTFNQLSSERR